MRLNSEHLLGLGPYTFSSQLSHHTNEILTHPLRREHRRFAQIHVEALSRRNLYVGRITSDANDI
jgi:hypothetical protein